MMKKKVSIPVKIKPELLALVDFFEDRKNEIERRKYNITREGGSKPSRSAFLRKVFNIFGKKLNLVIEHG